MFASVQCELNSGDVKCIPRKYQIFYVQTGFQKYNCKHLFSATSRKKILICLKFKKLYLIQFKIISLEPERVKSDQIYFKRYCFESDHPSKHGGLLEIILTVPLNHEREVMEREGKL